MSVVSIRTVVDLPAPLGPRKPKTSPSLTCRSTPRTASTAPPRPRVVLHESFGFHRESHDPTLGRGTDNQEWSGHRQPRMVGAPTTKNGRGTENQEWSGHREPRMVGAPRTLVPSNRPHLRIVARPTGSCRGCRCPCTTRSASATRTSTRGSSGPAPAGLGEDESGPVREYLVGVPATTSTSRVELVANSDNKLQSRGRRGGLAKDAVVLADGTELPANLVVYATGYGR